MKKINLKLNILEDTVTRWMAAYSLTFLRIALGIIYLWFGLLKFGQGLSPAELLAQKTITKLTFNALAPDFSIRLLALWECLIAIGLLTRTIPRITIILLFLQLIGTFLPLFFFSEDIWTINVFTPTLEGQYIIKNLILVSAAMAIYPGLKSNRLSLGTNRFGRA